MDVLECIATRRTTRKFLDIPVEFEKIGNILDAGRYAPSAGNLQDWKFILVTEKDTIENLAKCCLEQYWVSQASVVIVVCSDPEKSKRLYKEQGEKFSIQNGGSRSQ